MKYELREYQETAAREVLLRLAEAVESYRGKFNRRSSFALSAVTSSGKTVIAAAVIEALFNGSSALDVESDPDAVVLWLTDDESLNNQTRQRMIQSSELTNDQLVSINTPHFPDVLERRKVYFLNVQKLYDSSVKYTRSSDERPYSLWDTIKNTINDDRRMLYLVLDEAHKGMGNGKASRTTTVQRVINGHGDVPPVPVVWGISATTERFKEAMAKAEDRSSLPDCEVPVAAVQASGLLKDTIVLNLPDEKGRFDTVLLRFAVDKTIEQSGRWEGYCTSQGIDVVLPLLVVQVGNDPSSAELKRIVGTVQEQWTSASGASLGPDAIAHVFGDHRDINVAGRTVHYIQPEQVQDDTRVRVLLAKNAVTTGWDCPRAEVLISMRGSTDRTVITQFIGRMVRTPLARRIASDQLLNAVVCLLPLFDRKKTQEVAALLTDANYDGTEKGGGGGGPEAFAGPTVTLTQNASLPDDVSALFSKLPSESKPNPQAKPLPRLFAVATALAGDGIRPTGIDDASSHLYSVLDGQLAQHSSLVADRVTEIEKAHVATLVVDLTEGTVTDDSGTTLAADERLIDDAYRAATRAFTRQVANGYQKHRAMQAADADGQVDLIKAKVEVAALASIPEVVVAVNAAATQLIKSWFDQHDVAIANLHDAQRAEYDRIKDKSPVPMRRVAVLPSTKIEEAGSTDGVMYDTRTRHLLADESGNYPIEKLNGWERTVVDTELNRDGVEVVGWYRNPSQATENAIRVPYPKSGGSWSSFQPDFVFFTRKQDNQLAASLLEPHRDQGDTVPKLRGLADFAERYPDDYLRIEFMALNESGQMCKLDLKNPDVRTAVRASDNSTELFNGPHAQIYA